MAPPLLLLLLRERPRPRPPNWAPRVTMPARMPADEEVHQGDDGGHERAGEQEHDRRHANGQGGVRDEAGAGHGRRTFGEVREFQPGMSASPSSSSRTASMVASEGGRIRAESSS